MRISLRQHIIFWLGFILWDVLQTVASLAQKGEDLSSGVLSAAASTCLSVLVKILLAYIFLSIIVHYTIKGRKIPRSYFLFFLIIIILFVFVQRALMFYFIFPVIYKVDMSRVNFFGLSPLFLTMLDLLLPVAVLIIYELVRQTTSIKEKEVTLEKEKLRSELIFLKSQINPHFLFNVLSTIHALSRKESPLAADVTLKLSKLMRFMLYESTKDDISLNEEMAVLDNYIELESIRFQNKLNVQFEKEIGNGTSRIAPLILLPFVENAFKHGAAESLNNAYVNLKLHLRENNLYFNVENSFEPKVLPAPGTSGIGLTNVKRQLQLLYPSHELSCEQNNHSYCVSLKLNLQENDKTALHNN